LLETRKKSVLLAIAQSPTHVKLERDETRINTNEQFICLNGVVRVRLNEIFIRVRSRSLTRTGSGLTRAHEGDRVRARWLALMQRYRGRGNERVARASVPLARAGHRDEEGGTRRRAIHSAEDGKGRLSAVCGRKWRPIPRNTCFFSLTSRNVNRESSDDCSPPSLSLLLYNRLLLSLPTVSSRSISYHSCILHYIRIWNYLICKLYFVLNILN